MMPLPARYAQARSTVRGQRRMLRRLQREAEARDREITRLRTILSAHPDQLRRLLAAHPDEAKRMAVQFHDRCLELTRANAAKKCTSCDEADQEVARRA